MDINAEIAELLGWHKVKANEDLPVYHGFDLWRDKEGELKGVVYEAGFFDDFTFRPSENIAQCFEYIIPAMAAKGFEFGLRISNRTVRADFYDGDNMYAVTLADPTKAAECIVQAAVKAARAMEGRDA